MVCSCCVLSAKLRLCAVIVAAVHGVRVSGVTRAHGEAWLALQPIPCRDNGSGPVAAPWHFAPTKQNIARFVYSPSAWGAEDHVSTSVAMTLSKCSIKKNPRGACRATNKYPPPQTNLQAKRLQSKQLSVKCQMVRDGEKLETWPVFFSRCTVSAEENTKKYIKLNYKETKCWRVKEVNARVHTLLSEESPQKK